MVHNALYWKYLAIQIVEVHSIICWEPGSISVLIVHVRGDTFSFHFGDHLHKTVWDVKLGILVSWNQSLKTRSWLKASRFVMVGKMHQDISGRESTASAQRICLKAPAEVPGFPLPWCTNGAMGCSLFFRPWAAVMCFYPRPWLCPLLLQAPHCTVPCVTPGTVPRASWVLGNSQWPWSTTWLSFPIYYRESLTGRDCKNIEMYNRGKDLLKALARIAGTGGNRKLHFQGRRKIIHSGIPTSPCRNTSTACEDTFEENPNTVTKQLNFFFF